MRVGIIGGGASGLTAAYFAAKAGAQVTILEKNNRPGKKILATGNGKCNLSNRDFTPDYYNSADSRRVGVFFSKFSVSDTIDMFQEMGLMIKDKNGYLYPECEQASAVAEVFTYAMEHLKVVVKTGVQVTGIKKDKNDTFVVTGEISEILSDSDGRKNKGKEKALKNGRKNESSVASVKPSRHKFYFDRVILACGSRAGLSEASEQSENGLELLSFLKLSQVPRVPSLVQLRCAESFFPSLAGVRCPAEVVLKAGPAKSLREKGELQLTDYGISGIPVFQLSRHAAYYLLEKRVMTGYLDFLPDIPEYEWKNLMQKRRKSLGYLKADQFLIGTVNKKIAEVIRKEAGIPAKTALNEVNEKQFRLMVRLMKRLPITVVGTNPFASAQVCAGGIRLMEVSDDLEVDRCPGLFLAGEILDVDGRCGGYNLQWAWTSGAIAGTAAARLDEL